MAQILIRQLEFEAAQIINNKIYSPAWKIVVRLPRRLHERCLQYFCRSTWRTQILRGVPSVNRPQQEHWIELAYLSSAFQVVIALLTIHEHVAVQDFPVDTCTPHTKSAEAAGFVQTT